MRLPWSRDDRIFVLALFKVLQLSYRNKDPRVLEAARMTGSCQSDRSPDSIVYKLQNFRYLDTDGKSGFSHYASEDKEVWEEFKGREEALQTEAERIRSMKKKCKEERREEQVPTG